MTLGEQIWITAVAKIGGTARFWHSPEKALTELGNEIIAAIDGNASGDLPSARKPLIPAPIIPRRLGEGIARPFGSDDEIEDVV